MNDYEALQFETQGKLLEQLSNIQRNSAPIELSIGWVDNENIVRPGIMIKSAPPVVTQKLIAAGYNMEITNQGVKVFKV